MLSSRQFCLFLFRFNVSNVRGGVVHDITERRLCFCVFHVWMSKFVPFCESFSFFCWTQNSRRKTGKTVYLFSHWCFGFLKLGLSNFVPPSNEWYSSHHYFQVHQKLFHISWCPFTFGTFFASNTTHLLLLYTGWYGKSKIPDQGKLSRERCLLIFPQSWFFQ